MVKVRSANAAIALLLLAAIVSTVGTAAEPPGPQSKPAAEALREA
jgi:hypothetical protein